MIELEKQTLAKVEHLHDLLHSHIDQSAREAESIKRTIHTILWQGRKIMATQAELTAQVKSIGDSLTKIGAETTTLLRTVDELKQVIATGPAVTSELQAAVDAVSAQAKVVDDLVPDATPVVP